MTNSEEDFTFKVDMTERQRNAIINLFCIGGQLGEFIGGRVDYTALADLEESWRYARDKYNGEPYTIAP